MSLRATRLESSRWATRIATPTCSAIKSTMRSATVSATSTLGKRWVEDSVFKRLFSFPMVPQTRPSTSVSRSLKVAEIR